MLATMGIRTCGVKWRLLNCVLESYDKISKVSKKYFFSNFWSLILRELKVISTFFSLYPLAILLSYYLLFISFKKDHFSLSYLKFSDGHIFSRFFDVKTQISPSNNRVPTNCILKRFCVDYIYRVSRNP